ncbi:substrate-binding domain-containing protein [Dyella silvatica]|uniref:substrate-binding domain-containing protein n=1 Tax=Dyella silvatica TaxID=2992128 RepID=UPI0022501D33|nr:substrate-binding domain-containing protein [Dyella silvatica]
MKALAGAMLLGMVTLASAAHAGTTLVGGGATLPALGYGGDVTHRQITPVAGSLLAVYSAQTGNPQTSYCQTGSGAGKNILAGATVGTVVYNVQNACPDGAATPTGFGAPAVSRTDLTQPNFAGADSPLSLTDYSTYTTNRPSSKPIQFPAVAGAVAITFNKANVNSLALTDALVCKIFSGQISDWSDSQLVAAGVPAGVSGPINVVYRSDGSGTSFGFSNHLSSICGGTASLHFITDQSFAKVVSLYKPTIPTNWNGQSGNANVVNTVVGLDGAIGYAEAANVNNAAAQFATVNGFDPVADLSNKITISSSSVVYNSAINGADPTTGKAVVSAISPAPSTSCIALVQPSAYAIQSSGYPIVAVSYLLGNSNGNGTDAANVRTLLGAPYNSTITNAVTTIGNTSLNQTGLAFLNVDLTSSTYATNQARVNACVAN